MKFPTKGRIASKVEPEDPEWIWYPYIPAGAITLVGARGGTGKGVMIVKTVATITIADHWPFSGDQADLGNILWCEAEDTFNHTVVPRLIASKADRDRVILEKPEEFLTRKDLRKFIDGEGIRLIVLSPLNSFLKLLKDANSGHNVRQALQEIQDNIENTLCGVVGICHLNKKPDLIAVERLLGSVEYANFVRSVLMLNQDEADQTLVRVAHAKHNLSPKGDDLLFSIHNRKPTTHPRGQYISIGWRQSDANVDLDHLYDRKKGSKTSAGEWLSQLLNDGEEVDCQEIFQKGQPYGHSENALKQAKLRDPGIEHRTVGFGKNKTTYWFKSKNGGDP